jgi:hypothetical protein
VPEAVAESNPKPRWGWWRTLISTLLHPSITLRDENGDETESSHSSEEEQKNRRVRTHMIRRIDDKPKLVNPSGWISEGRLPVAQEGLVESGSISSIREQQQQQPTDLTLAQSPELTHLQPSNQQSNDSEAESESELEDLSEIPRRGRANRRVPDSGTFPHRKFVLDERASFLLTPPTQSHPHRITRLCIPPGPRALLSPEPKP